MTVRGLKNGAIRYSANDDGDEYSGTLEIDGVSDVLVAVGQATAYLSPYFGTLKNKSIDTRHLGAGVWEADFVYREQDPGEGEEPEIGDVEYGIDRSNSQQRIYIALDETVFQKAGAGAAADFQKIIGQVKDGQEPEGVEKFFATATYTETHYLTPQDWTLNKMREFAIKETVKNSAQFRVWETGELLYLGHQAMKQKGQTILPVSFSWAVSANAPNLQVGDIQNINKPGWDYLWTRTVKKENANRGVQPPEVVIVNKIYEAEDFNAWGLGVPNV